MVRKIAANSIMMKIMLLSTAVIVHAQNWQRIESSDANILGADLFIDLNSVIKNGKMRNFVWLANRSSEAQKINESISMLPEGVNSMIGHDKMDCDKRSDKTLYYSFYKGLYGENAFMSERYAADIFSSIKPNSFYENVERIICSK